jgi:hypothetical protein
MRQLQQHNFKPSTNSLLIVLFLYSLLVLGAQGFPAIAQDVSPTPGPTKTPASTSSPQPQVERTPVPFETLTQADLRVLTGNVQRPNGITWYDGNLYSVCTGDGTVDEINDTTGATITYIWGINNAHSLYAEEDENGNLRLWIPDFGANTLALITRSGVRTVVADLRGPWGIAPIGDDFLITNLLGNTLIRASRDGAVTTLLEGLAAPTGIAIDDEFVYIANTGSTRRAIEFYSRADLEAGTVRPEDDHRLVTGLQNVTGIQLGSDGYLYFAYAIGTRGVVGRVDPAVCRSTEGGCSNAQIEVVIFSELETPIAGLTVTPDMRIYLHTMFEPEIFWAQL